MSQNFNHQLFLSILSKNDGEGDEIISIKSLSGGDINRAVRVDTKSGSWFAKWNDDHLFPGMFEAEAKGLMLLKNSGSLYIPYVIGTGKLNHISMLVLEFIKQGRDVVDFMRLFGHNLAVLHNNSAECFGLDHHNYIGSLPQVNTHAPTWIDFFIAHRLEFQIKLARDNGRIDQQTVKMFETMYPSLTDFFPPEKPSLLHGDLWSGNYMVGPQGQACIYDPAVYYGHRLMDIGMSRLFGGFSNDFYEGYNEIFPLEKNWLQGVEIANLYPLMVHLNLFGGGYLSSVNTILKRF